MRTSVSFVFDSPDEAAEFLERVQSGADALTPLPPSPRPPPPPSAVPPAPPPPVTVPSLPVSDVERDAGGNVWDEEIHASTKAKTKDGMWRRKRGVSAQDAASTVAGRGLAAIPGGLTVPPPPPPVTPTASWDAVTTAFGKRIVGYTQEQIQTALREGGIDPVQLFAHPEWYAQSIAILDARCPV